MSIEFKLDLTDLMKSFHKRYQTYAIAFISKCKSYVTKFTNS